MATTKEEMLIEEWKDIRETLRYFGNKRFAQFTVFISVNAVMIDAYFKETITGYKMVIALAGVIGALIFWSMEYGSVAFWKLAAKRGVTIETEATIPLQLFTSYRPKEGILSATFATYSIYVVMALLWILMLLTTQPPPQKPLTSLIDQTLLDAASLSGQKGSQWNLQASQWDSSSSSYIMTMVETGTGKAMVVTVDSTSGKYVKVARP